MKLTQSDKWGLTLIIYVGSIIYLIILDAWISTTYKYGQWILYRDMMTPIEAYIVIPFLIMGLIILLITHKPNKGGDNKIE